MFLYIGTTDNKLGVVQVDDELSNVVRSVQIVTPVVMLADLPPSRKNALGMVSKPKIDTEWIVKHPKLDLLYAFTSFMTQDDQALLTTYQIDRNSGQLTKLGKCRTGGLQACYATFSNDASLLVVAHHNDGKLVFFDTTPESGGVPEGPLQVVDTPEVRPGTRTTAFPNCLPSLHHILYSHDGKYLLTMDSSPQSRIWTYATDHRGRLLSDKPRFKQKLHPIRALPSTAASLVSAAFQWTTRIRRAALHPSGKYLYVLMETHCLLQVYEISREGKILADCLQEIPTIDPAYFQTLRWNGMAISAAAELKVTQEGVWVSNRGMTSPLGRAESSVRVFAYEEGGARLSPAAHLKTAGPVRHFAFGPSFTESDRPDVDKILVGINAKAPGVVEMYRRIRQGDAGGNGTAQAEKTGEAFVGMDVFCVVPVSENPGGV